MQRTSWTVGLYLMLVFTSGILVGAFGHRFYAVKSVSANDPALRTPAKVRDKYVNEMQTRLKLRPEQVTQLQGILNHTHEEWWAYRDRHKTELKAIQDDQIARVRAILSPEQVVDYQKVVDEQERERRTKEERDRKPN